MAKTLNEWATEIAKWADEKGWWEPQCNHEFSESRGIIDSTLRTVGHYDWCRDCGGIRFDGGWLLPRLARERNQGELHMLFVTEIAESFEEIRNNRAVNEIYTMGPKPEGVPIEIADLLIRVLDWAGHYNIDLDAVMEQKMAYNWTRPYRHGGKSA